MVRNEYPRPQFERNEWMNLNGTWSFDFDDNNVGIVNKWYENPQLEKEILVPYTFQCKLSNIDIQDFHDIVWYARSFDLTDAYKNKKIILHFGAVDYIADVWVNGEHFINHEGGHVPFSIDITRAIKDRGNLLVVRAEDPTKNLELPRGKQYWEERSKEIFYTRTTGIWQTVWLEALENTYLDHVWMTPNLDEKCVSIEYEVNGYSENTELKVEISLDNCVMIEETFKVIDGKGNVKLALDKEPHLQIDLDKNVWTPENPVLFDINFKVIENEVELDNVNSYFGLRKVSIIEGEFLLNNKPYYQKLLLDQGYWEDSLLTAPTDEDFIKDIELSKQMGFNGVRKHQKIEDPRYLYWADKLGFIVWGEAANAYHYSRKYANRMTKEWMEMIKRDYNHPCILAWTPLNESWGVESIATSESQQSHATAMYWLTKSLDSTRPVISNDGWEHTKTDLLTIHDYSFDSEVLKTRYENKDSAVSARPVGRDLFVEGWSYSNQPIIISEMGGISYKKSEWEGWGYSSANSDEDFIERYYNVISPILQSPIVQGFCYTQITDVEQEINGLLTYARQPKVDLSVIKAINEGTYIPPKK